MKKTNNTDIIPGIICERIDTVTYRTHVTEESLRERLTAEFLQNVGFLNADGTQSPGVKFAIHRGAGRKGGYSLTAQRDLAEIPAIEVDPK